MLSWLDLYSIWKSSPSEKYLHKYFSSWALPVGLNEIHSIHKQHLECRSSLRQSDKRCSLSIKQTTTPIVSKPWILIKSFTQHAFIHRLALCHPCSCRTMHCIIYSFDFHRFWFAHFDCDVRQINVKTFRMLVIFQWIRLVFLIYVLNSINADETHWAFISERNWRVSWFNICQELTNNDQFLRKITNTHHKHGNDPFINGRSECAWKKKREMWRVFEVESHWGIRIVRAFGVY